MLRQQSHRRPSQPRRGFEPLRVLSGIIHVIGNSLSWRDAPIDYGPKKTLYNRWARWCHMGVVPCSHRADEIACYTG